MQVGRPTLFTPETISKLEHAFSIGCTDLEACLYAGIGKSALYNYQADHPEFVERKEKLKESLVLRARLNLAKRINSDDKPNLGISQWYLERKRKEEFSTRNELTGKDGDSIEINISQEQLQAIAKEVIESRSNESDSAIGEEKSDTVLDGDVVIFHPV